MREGGSAAPEMKKAGFRLPYSAGFIRLGTMNPASTKRKHL